MEYTFPTELHALGFKYYNHIPKTKDDSEFILKIINEDNLENFVETYLASSQFNIDQNIRKLWNEIKDAEYPSLKGFQEDMLIYLLNMYCCQINRKKRVKKLKHGTV